MPQTVTQSSTTLATYTYDATGEKLRNTGSDGSWDYIDGIVYQNGAISFIQTEEGRASVQGGAFHYEYNLKDHHGNVRYSFDKDPTSGTARRIQEDEYYSFGLRETPIVYDFSNNNRYLYNGKEIQTDLTSQYDYGARFYDPVIARWTSVDPLVEKGRRWTLYNYAFSNPGRFLDPDGMWGLDGTRTFISSNGYIETYDPNTLARISSIYQEPEDESGIPAVTTAAIPDPYGATRASVSTSSPQDPDQKGLPSDWFINPKYAPKLPALHGWKRALYYLGGDRIYGLFEYDADGNAIRMKINKLEFHYGPKSLVNSKNCRSSEKS